MAILVVVATMIVVTLTQSFPRRWAEAAARWRHEVLREAIAIENVVLGTGQRDGRNPRRRQKPPTAAKQALADRLSPPVLFAVERAAK